MNLCFTTDKLRIVLGAAKTTTDMPVLVVYHDVPAQEKTDNSEYQSGRQLTNSNGVTATDILASPSRASLTRKVDYLAVYNADTATKDVSIQYYDGTTAWVVKKAIALAVGATLSWTPGNDWQVL